MLQNCYKMFEISKTIFHHGQLNTGGTSPVWDAYTAALDKSYDVTVWLDVHTGNFKSVFKENWRMSGDAT
jgi:hypothetical protein